MLIEKVNKKFVQELIAVLMILAIAAIAVSYLTPIAKPYIFPICAAVVLIFAFFYYPKEGFYLLVLSYPFIGLQLRAGEVNMPLVDLLSIALFAAVFLRFLFVDNGWKGKTFWKKVFLGLPFILPFFAACALALFNNEFFFSGFKYWLRPILFLYLMFIVLPNYIIRDKRQFVRLLIVCFAVGLAVACLGLLSLFYSSAESFSLARATPIVFGEWNPLGGNHNAVAEVLVVVLPITMILYGLSDKIKNKGMYLLAGIFMAIILGLTFSRAGYLAILVEAAIFLLLYSPRRMERRGLFGLILFIVIALLIVYFPLREQLHWLRASDANRVLMTALSWQNFLEHPIIGNGLNTFQTLIGRSFIYSVEFGNPLESHGFIQKLMVETGVAGVLAFFVWLGYLFQRFWRAAHENQIAKHHLINVWFFVIFCGIIVFQLFSTSYFLSITWLPIGLFLAGGRLFSDEYAKNV